MDANEIGSSGYWVIMNENRPSNLPYVGNGMLISFVASTIKVQLVFDKNASKGYWRMLYLTWTEWKEL